jgi:carboxymethylenebutenolidase
MCFDHDSQPPIAPIAGGASDARRLTITSGDGAEFSAFAAHAARPTGARILILPDVRGLHRYYEELAMRFAEHGVDALSIDYFCRTAGTGPRDADFEYRPHVEQTRWETLSADIRAGFEQLRAGAGGAGGGRGASAADSAGAADSASVADGAGAADGTSIFVTGFCMGGRLAFDATTLGLGFAGAIGFYGWPTGTHRSGSPAPAEVADQIECPILALFGGADEGLGPDVRAAFDRALSDADVEHEVVTYEGAPHSFFDRKASEFQDASDAAWAKTLEFMRAHTAA